MGKLALTIFLIFLAALMAFAIVNTDTTTIKVPFSEVYELPKIVLIMGASFVGALTMLMAFIIRDTKRFVESHQHTRMKKKEERIQGLYSRALNAILAGGETEARTALEEIITDEPEHTASLLRLGDLAFASGEYGPAASWYKRALASNPEDFEALFSIEKTMEATARWPEALKYLDQILDIDADNLSALYKRRGILERQEKWEDVIDVQKSIIKHEEPGKDTEREEANMLGYRYEFARDALEKGQREKANKEFRTILKSNTKFVPAYLGVAEVMAEDGENDDAVNFLDKGYEDTGSPIILARLEDLLISLGDPSRIIKIYENAVVKKPNDSTLRFFLGKLYYRLEMIDDAFTTLKAIDASEPFPALYHLLGELHMRRNQCAEAVKEFKKTIDIKNKLRTPYCCSSCGRDSEEWSGRCTECGSWNTYFFNLKGNCRV